MLQNSEYRIHVDSNTIELWFDSFMAEIPIKQIYFAYEWTSFYVIGTSVMKELN